MPFMMIKLVGPGEYSTAFVGLHSDYDISSPLRPGEVVEVTDEDWAFFKERLPWNLELVTEAEIEKNGLKLRKVFDKTSMGDEPFTYFSLPVEQVERPLFTPAQQAEVDRLIAEREAQVRADNPNWIDPALIPPSDNAGTSALTAEEEKLLFEQREATRKKAAEEAGDEK